MEDTVWDTDIINWVYSYLYLHFNQDQPTGGGLALYRCFQNP